jgi:transposase-like protein
MDRSLFKKSFIHDEAGAHEFVERIRWPNGPICPHCQATRIYRLKPNATGRRVLKCGACRKQFTVMVGTIFEDSHLPLTKWVAAIHLICSSKKGISTHQLHRMLGISYKSVWFMAHRIRHALKQLPAVDKLKGIIEADECYIGGRVKGGPDGHGRDNKTPVFSLVERKGRVRSFTVPKVTAKNLKTIIRENVERESQIMTDSFLSYRGLKREFADHQTVDHSIEEWVRGEAHVNTAEAYFSLLKRGINGTFHHVSSHHLHRYLAEFDFRYNARHQ